MQSTRSAQALRVLCTGYPRGQSK
ncbi:hypothetical protein BOSEA31B_20565 [Hyphomicrobiales bacterium]|nr:hypothetical protein BOSEA31B_20565 [Hyphomicrobiales bacterium]CAH1702944.1 hypothetical protein BOSEA1005_30816 [Hyphomicrobiales bacterium]CAI0347129.1 hypothetical protein BO1005MUT1_530305 [Hyphomicrobiales bacterium]